MRTGNVLICPLEWGLGHTARMIPIAASLRERGFTVIAAGGEAARNLFSAELKDTGFIDFPGFQPRYSKILPAWLAMLCRIPSFIYHSCREHRQLKKIIRDNDINIVISDNRFGLWNRDVTSLYVTHQLRIPFPRPFRFAEGAGILLHRLIIRRYDFCFIPDLPGDMNLSGRLSHGIKLPRNTIYSGILSRFSLVSSEKMNLPEGRCTVVLSGPEPQRGILKEKIISHFSGSETPVIILGGRPGSGEGESRAGNITIYDHLAGPFMKAALEGSSSVISRSGYTSIMELVSLGCTALLIPTPGQTEQEYLAEYLSSKGWFRTISQGEIDSIVCEKAEVQFNSREFIMESEKLLNAALDKLSEYKKA